MLSNSLQQFEPLLNSGTSVSLDSSANSPHPHFSAGCPRKDGDVLNGIGGTKVPIPSSFPASNTLKGIKATLGLQQININSSNENLDKFREQSSPPRRLPHCIPERSLREMFPLAVFSSTLSKPSEPEKHQKLSFNTHCHLPLQDASKLAVLSSSSLPSYRRGGAQSTTATLKSGSHVMGTAAVLVTIEKERPAITAMVASAAETQKTSASRWAAVPAPTFLKDITYSSGALGDDSALVEKNDSTYLQEPFSRGVLSVFFPDLGKKNKGEVLSVSSKRVMKTTHGVYGGGNKESEPLLDSLTSSRNKRRQLLGRGVASLSSHSHTSLTGKQQHSSITRKPTKRQEKKGGAGAFSSVEAAPGGADVAPLNNICSASASHGCDSYNGGSAPTDRGKAIMSFTRPVMRHSLRIVNQTTAGGDASLLACAAIRKGSPITGAYNKCSSPLERNVPHQRNDSPHPLSSAENSDGSISYKTIGFRLGMNEMPKIGFQEQQGSFPSASGFASGIVVGRERHSQHDGNGNEDADYHRVDVTSYTDDDLPLLHRNLRFSNKSRRATLSEGVINKVWDAEKMTKSMQQGTPGLSGNEFSHSRETHSYNFCTSSEKSRKVGDGEGGVRSDERENRNADFYNFTDAVGNGGTGKLVFFTESIPITKRDSLKDSLQRTDERKKRVEKGERLEDSTSRANCLSGLVSPDTGRKLTEPWGTVPGEDFSGAATASISQIMLKILSNKRIYRIVLTGGPCAGKSTMMAMLQQKVPQRYNMKVFCVPEAASLLVQGGLEWSDDYEISIKYQLALLRVQLALEDQFYAIAEACESDALIVCDRGTMDGCAYTVTEQFKYILKIGGWTLDQLRDERYDAVIHMMSAACGSPQHYNLDNPARYENLQEAMTVDAKLRKIYVGHHNLRIFDNSAPTFQAKLDRVFEFVGEVCGKSALNPRAKKFCVKELPCLDVLPEDTVMTTLTTTILNMSSLHLQYQIVMREQGGNALYFYIVIRKEKASNEDHADMLVTKEGKTNIKRDSKVLRESFMTNSLSASGAVKSLPFADHFGNKSAHSHSFAPVSSASLTFRSSISSASLGSVPPALPPSSPLLILASEHRISEKDYFYLLSLRDRTRVDVVQNIYSFMYSNSYCELVIIDTPQWVRGTAALFLEEYLESSEEKGAIGSQELSHEASALQTVKGGKCELENIPPFIEIGREVTQVEEFMNIFYLSLKSSRGIGV